MDIRFLVIPFVLICLAFVEIDNRNFLHRNFSDDELKGYHSPFAALIACGIIFFAFLFLFPSHNDEYIELKEKYEEVSVSIDTAREDAITALMYFNGEEDVTKEDAESSLYHILDNLEY